MSNFDKRKLSKNYTRYLICPYYDKLLLVETYSIDTSAYCQFCKKSHGFSKMNKAMGGMEYGKLNNSWVESW